MDSTDESFTTFTTKGRRTKRPRTMIATTATTTTATTSSHVSYVLSDEDHDAMSSITTTEEEDMANCLILLSQGAVLKRKAEDMRQPKAVAGRLVDDLSSNPVNKINKKIRAGVYECKTCNKTFSSFQALGGHRTSHKKVNVPKPPTKIEHVAAHNELIVFDHFAPGVVISDGTEFDTSRHKRVHVCLICRSEFQSGQALGGHMRRHRPVVVPANTMVSIDDSCGSGRSNILPLDLNLPALDDNDDLAIVETTKFDLETNFLTLAK